MSLQSIIGASAGPRLDSAAHGSVAAARSSQAIDRTTSASSPTSLGHFFSKVSSGLAHTVSRRPDHGKVDKRLCEKQHPAIRRDIVRTLPLVAAGSTRLQTAWRARTRCDETNTANATPRRDLTPAAGAMSGRHGRSAVPARRSRLLLVRRREAAAFFIPRNAVLPGPFQPDPDPPK